MKMRFILHYPDLHISQELFNFGLVFIGNSKTALIQLTNTTGTHVEFNVAKPLLGTAFKVIPAKGIISKAEGITPAIYSLTISFQPSESKDYQDEFLILTNIPFLCKKFKVTGTGTNNEKFHEEGI